MHVAIIGCGISGLLSALELVEQGVSVDLFDQQQPAKAASWAGGGILSPMYPWRYPQAVNALAQHGKALYHAWNELLYPRTQIDFEIHETGLLIFDPEDVEIGLNFAKAHQQPMQHAQLLQAEQLHQLNPRLSTSLTQALHFSQIANIRNPRLLKSILSYLKQHPNVNLHANTWVDDFELTQGKISALKLQQGQRFAVDQVLITTGAWSAHWSNRLGTPIPVHPVQGQMLLFKTPQHWLPTMCMNQVMYLIPRQDGHLVCGSSMQELGFEHRPNLATQQRIYAACLEMVPELAHFPIVKQWAGLRPSSPEGIPYIGLHPELSNAWLNFGHYRNGLCMGPAAAQLLRQLMLKQKTIVDPNSFNPQRLWHTSALTE